MVRELPPHYRRVLDVGCGAGALAARLAAHAVHVDALDRSPVMIEAARRVVGGNVTCLLGDIRDHPLPADGYDAIVSVAVLHHLPADQVVPSSAGRPTSRRTTRCRSACTHR